MPVTDILTDNETVLLFDPLNKDDLSSRIRNLIENKDIRNKLSDSAFKTLMNKHTWHHNAEKIIVTSECL